MPGNEGHMNILPDWLYTQFDERQTKQMEFSVIYAKDFHHGADGHNSMLIIAKLVDLIRDLTSDNAQPGE